MQGMPSVTSKDRSIVKKRRPKYVTPSWLLGFKKTNLGFAIWNTLLICSSLSSPVKMTAWPPRRSGTAAVTAAASWRKVTPSGTLAAGLQTTPAGTWSRILMFSIALSESAPSTTTASVLFQSFWTSPSARRRRPSRAQRVLVSRLPSSSALMADSTEPSAFSGTSSGKVHSRRATGPSRRPFFSSKDSTPLPTAASAAARRALQGPASNSGSSVRDTRMVSPRPSSSSAPMPTADLMRPSAPPPASVTPRCRG
mmetsp:Transcript_2611/g.7431  ORF Transcript_2611/g.7431 Transcript_2611/m.7431 type:complete len:254 (+) Transcript_2611:677-1438(+)